MKNSALPSQGAYSVGVLREAYPKGTAVSFFLWTLVLY